MKKFKKIVAVALLGGVFALSFGAMKSNSGLESIADDAGRVKIYLVNKCSVDTKVKVASPGSSTHYTVGDKEKKPFSFMEGTKVYDENGNLIVEVGEGDSNQEFVVCD